MKKTFKLVLSFALALQLMPTANLKVSATTGYFDVNKISNPDSTGPNDADGLVSETDRGNSYAWSMAETEQYVWIGMNRNLLVSSASVIIPGLSLEQLDQILSTLSNGVMPSDVATMQNQKPVIMRYSKADGSLEKIYESPTAFVSDAGVEMGNDFGFRVAVSYKGSVYFGTMGAGSGVNSVLRFDETMGVGSTPETVYELPLKGDQSSIRAMTIHNNQLCIGVTNGENSVAIFTSENPGLENWEQVADASSFNNEVRSGFNALSGGGLWDITSFNGYLYASIVTSGTPSPTNDETYSGFGLYKGQADENGNWNWYPVVSNKDGGKYPLGMGNNVGTLATPYVYNGKLYVGTFNEPIHGIMQFVSTGSVEGIYQAMQTSTQLFSFDADDNAELIAGNANDVFPNGSKSGLYAGYLNEQTPNSTFYTWKMEEHNGSLYIGTFDGYALLRLLAPLKTGKIMDFFEKGWNANNNKARMASTEEEMNTSDYIEIAPETWQQVSDEVAQLQEDVEAASEENTKAARSAEVMSIKDVKSIVDNVATVQNNLNELKTMMATAPTRENLPIIQKILDDTQKLLDVILAHSKFLPQTVIDTINTIKSVISFAQTFVSNFDFVKYFLICDDLSNSEARGDMGADLLVLSNDGATITPVTMNGFNNQYNYGFRTLKSLDDKVLVGTANPFYGAQLWSVDDGTRPSAELTPSEEVVPAEKITPATKKSPNTGDTTSVGLLIVAALASCGTVVVALKRRKAKI